MTATTEQMIRHERALHECAMHAAACSTEF